MVIRAGSNRGNKSGDRKYQWGAETSTRPLAIMHAQPSPVCIVFGYIAIVCTVISWLVYMITMILSLFINNPSLTLRFVVEGRAVHDDRDYADLQCARIFGDTTGGNVPFPAA